MQRDARRHLTCLWIWPCRGTISGATCAMGSAAIPEYAIMG
jgi:hypothetical protein